MRFTNLLSVHPLGMRAAVPYQAQRPRQHFMRATTGPQCVLTVDGTYASQAACLGATTCGWKYKCANGSCVLASDGTYGTQAECFAVCSKWGCDGAGNCVPKADGVYNSPSECRCYSCANNTCAPVAVNAKGDFATKQECETNPTAQCGWTFACASVADGGDAASFCKKQPYGPFATAADCRCVTALGAPGPTCTCGYDPAAPADKTKYASLTTCRQGPADQCGWNYGCNPQLSFSFPASTLAAAKYNTLTNNTCSNSFPCAKYIYFIMGVFTATKPVGRFTIGSGTIGVSGGGGSDWSEADYVLIKYGNYEVNKADSTTATYTSPKNGQTINVGANVIVESNNVAAGLKRTINGRDTQPVAGWTNYAKALEVGWQYALAYRLYSQCDENTIVGWGASTVTLSDS